MNKIKKSRKQTMKKEIYFNEINLLMGSGGIVYLPFVSGILSSYIKTSQFLKNKIKVMPYIFIPDTVDNLIKKYNNPSVAAFSISMWNEQISLKLARTVKQLFPNCLIIFGGAQCPHEPTEYMNSHKFIDICVRAEGEDAFYQIITTYIAGRNNYAGIPNTAYREGKEIIINKIKPIYTKDLNYPSPYLVGEYDYLLKNKEHNFHTIIETNRGCPFLCTFCYWGRGGNTQKYRFKKLETIYEEIGFFSKHKIEYVFNADSNFGMHKRDYEIGLKLIQFNNQTGYPEKFRTCWGKNTSERIFKIASLLHYNNMDKGVTLARQSNNKEVLINVKRDNIKLEAYSVLQEKFNKLNVPIYTEMIIGLPGETLDSWKKGIEELFETNYENQLSVYLAEVYPNTELASKEYQKKYEIKTKRIKLNEIHCSPKNQKWLQEYQEILVGTYSMDEEEWCEMMIFSIFTMLFHTMKTGFYILKYLHERVGLEYVSVITMLLNSNETSIANVKKEIVDYVNKLLEGEGRGKIYKKYSNNYLEIEEVLFLRITENISIYNAVKTTLFENIDNKFHEEISDVIKFQKILIPHYQKESSEDKIEFKYEVADYFYSDNHQQMIKNDNVLTVLREGYKDRSEFTNKKVIWARKNGTNLDENNKSINYKKSKLINFDINDYKDENTFSISLFDETTKFEKFITV